VHHRGHCAGQAGARCGAVAGRHVHLRRRGARRLNPHRRMPVLHDVPDHGEDRLRRGPPGRTQCEAGRADAVCELGDQTVHDVCHRSALPRRALPRLHRRGGGGLREDALRARPGTRPDVWRRHGRVAGRREDARSAALAQLPGGVHTAGHCAVHGHGAGLGLSGQRQRRPHAGHGGHQLADDAAPVRSVGRVPAGGGAVARAVAGPRALDRHLRSPAAGGRVPIAQVDHPRERTGMVRGEVPACAHAYHHRSPATRLPSCGLPSPCSFRPTSSSGSGTCWRRVCGSLTRTLHRRR